MREDVGPVLGKSVSWDKPQRFGRATTWRKKRPVHRTSLKSGGSCWVYLFLTAGRRLLSKPSERASRYSLAKDFNRAPRARSIRRGDAGTAGWLAETTHGAAAPGNSACINRQSSWTTRSRNDSFLPRRTPSEGQGKQLLLNAIAKRLCSNAARKKKPSERFARPRKTHVLPREGKTIRIWRDCNGVRRILCISGSYGEAYVTTTGNSRAPIRLILEAETFRARSVGRPVAAYRR